MAKLYALLTEIYLICSESCTMPAEPKLSIMGFSGPMQTLIGYDFPSLLVPFSGDSARIRKLVNID